jgi:hypothetical protein
MTSFRKYRSLIFKKNRPMTIHRTATLIVASVCAFISACSSVGQKSTAANNGKTPQQLDFKLASGTYSCEQGQRIDIQRSTNQIKINWQGNRHTLQRYDSSSGLPKFEDRQNGLMWIDLPWKGVLMDTNSGRPLVNDCKVASR